MADFDFIEWRRLLADLDLEPLPAGTGDIMAALVRAGDWGIQAPEGRELLMLRLAALRLVHVEPPSWDDCFETYRSSSMLREIMARGLLDQLPGVNA